MTLPETARSLIESGALGHLATIGADGAPQVTCVWVAVDCDDLLTAHLNPHQRKLENVRRDPRVTVTVVNHDNPYEYAQIRGRVVDDTHEGADENIDKLAKKYLDKDEYPFRQPGEQRVMFRIEPERVKLHGG